MPTPATTADTPSAPRIPDTPQPTSGDHVLFLAVLTCFFLSGFAALVYQTAWMRQFSVVFGTSELAVATVLAAYMAGLALGAAWAGRILPRVKRPILWYGVLEAGVALGALCVPIGLSIARFLQATMIGGQSELVHSGGLGQSTFYLITTFLIVLVPTTCMGATLPLLARHVVRRRDHIGPRIGLLYTINTAGAVAGTLCGAFILLPTLGLAGTVWVGIAANLCVFVVAALLARQAPAPVPVASPEMDSRAAARESVGDRRALLILPFIAISGSISFTYEVLWTRLLAHILGGSVYAFAAMLASFLTGITVGGAVASLLARSRQAAAVGFVICQIGIAVLSAWIFDSMDALPAAYLLQVSEAGASPQAVGANLTFTLLLPATVLIGATFPFALRILARSRENAAGASARVYSWNTVGAIAGALISGFFLIPHLGFEGTTRLAVAASLGLAAAASLAFLWPKQRLLTLTTCASLGLMALYHPTPPLKLLRHELEPAGDPAGEILFRAVGQSASVLVVDQTGTLEIRSNGLPEAGITPEGTPPFGRNAERFLTILPVLARPAARSMLVIGFGGGVALEAVPPSIEELDVIELEPEVISANRLIAPLRDVDPFKDPRLNIVLNDARGALTLTEKRWDILVSQPSHPWTAGASHLYTAEFASLCRDHLTPDGVFVQWINAGFLNPELFASVGATLLDTFEHVCLYRPVPSMLLFLASDAPLQAESDLARTGAPISADPEYWSRMGVSDANELLALLALDEEGLRTLCADGIVSNDNRNVLAMSSGLNLPGALHMESTWAMLAPADPLLRAGSTLRAQLGNAIRPFSLQRAVGAVSPLRAQALGESLQAAPEPAERLYYQVGSLLPAAGRGAPGTESLQALANSWTGIPQLIWKGWRALGRGRHEALHALDEPLNQVAPSSAWHSHAMQLRAHLRLSVPDVKVESALEAIESLDRAIIREPAPELLALRLEAAAQAQWPKGIVATLRELMVWLGPAKEGLSPAALQDLYASLRPWPARLSALRNMWDTSPDAELIGALDELHNQLIDRLPAQPQAPTQSEEPSQLFR